MMIKVILIIIKVLIVTHEEEHKGVVKKLVEDMKILIKGDIIDGGNEMFFIFNSKDEREPHSFIMKDISY